MTDSSLKPESSFSKWCVAPAGEGDSREIQALFHKVFGHRMDQEYWHWKYGDGRGMAWLAKRKDKLVAHYGGIERDIYYKGKVKKSIQCVDTMVDISERGSLSRKGPYCLVAKAFLDQYVGYGRPYEFGFGFPNARVMKLGEILGIQAKVGNVLEPVWAPIEIKHYLDSDYDPTNHQHKFIANKVDQCLRNSLGADAIIGIRNADYLAYRYFSNPKYNYQVKIVTDIGSQQSKGIVVYRVEKDRMLILDIIADVRDFPQLITQLRYYCIEQRAYEMSAWISSNHLSLLGDAWGRLDDPMVAIPSSICTDGPTPDELKDKWYLSAGDTDFK